MTQGVPPLLGHFVAARESDQAAALALGSRSTISAACPASSAATAKLSARDVLPTPPFF